MKQIQIRLNYANVVSTLALVFAMSGGALAANHYLINSTHQISPKVLKKLKGRTGRTGPAGPVGPRGSQGATGHTGATGKNGANALAPLSAYAQDQNQSVYVDSSTETVAVQLTAAGGKALTVTVPSHLNLSGVVSLRNSTGAGNSDQSGCQLQVAPVGGAFKHSGPEMLGLTNGYSSFSDEASIPLVGEMDVTPGTYDARIVCHRIASTGANEQNKFNGDAISVTAIAG